MKNKLPHVYLALAVVAACFVLGAHSYVQLPANVPTAEPVTIWLLTPNLRNADGSTGIPNRQRAAWKKVGSKLWYFISNLDYDFVDSQGKTVPPALGVRRAFGPTVTCGRFARQWIRMAFHDCGTFDVGNTGSEGDTGKARFGCNGSLRKEVAPCEGGPGCWKGVERRFDLATGAWINETVFEGLEARHPGKVDWAIDKVNQRHESTGFGMSLALFYQVMLEARNDSTQTLRLPSLSFADMLIYAGMLGVAKCGGPQIEFQPGRVDADIPDAPHRLPESTESLSAVVAYFWTNGVTNFDMVNLLAAHSTACFSVGCMDNTPSRFDSNWATQLLSVTRATDPRICQLDAEGKPLRQSTHSCILPSDAELAARDDTRAYLHALTTGNRADLTRAANNANPPFNPESLCPARDSCTARPVPWSPFRIFNAVNLCNRLEAAPVGCSRSPDQANLHDAVATSYFKMSKWYAITAPNRRSVYNQGLKWDVRSQPCQPGLIKIGAAEELTPSTVCSCCPTPLPQRFSYVPPKRTADRNAPSAMSDDMQWAMPVAAQKGHRANKQG